MDDFERFVAARRRGLYESCYLKANDPAGGRALWIKHNLLRRPGDRDPSEDRGEFWIVLWEEGRPVAVARRDLPLAAVRADPARIALEAGPVRLSPERAEGAIAGFRWRLRLSGGAAPLHHLPWAWMYRGGLPRKKILTPAPNLRFDGEIEGPGIRWRLDGWVGLRGHNWGTEHAWTYAYGNANLWDDGAADRTVDGFSARILLGGRPSPWLSSVVGRAPALDRRRWWFARAEVAPGRWRVAWRGLSLEMEAPADSFVALLYEHPDGRESVCTNTKFARVRLRAGAEEHTSRLGELEVLFPEAPEGTRVHPAAGWEPGAGDYSWTA